jgi:hypothetical protein
MKIRAITKEDDKIARRVTGRKNINSPAIPGQKINGKNAAKVVDVEANTGINIFFADKIKTFSLLIPSLALLLAYSTTIIAPSIRIPTDRINEKRTTTLMVTSKKDKIIIDNKKENGIDILTRTDDFKPIKSKVIKNTIIVARITLFSRSLT